MRQLFLSASLLLMSGCIWTRESSPPGLDSAVVQHAEATRAWEVRSRGIQIGSVVRFESVLGPERFFFVVRNEHGQDLGVIDALGRAYRNRPFEDKPEWLGSGTVLDGACRILELGAGAELIETRAPLASPEPAPSD